MGKRKKPKHRGKRREIPFPVEEERRKKYISRLMVPYNLIKYKNNNKNNNNINRLKNSPPHTLNYTKYPHLHTYISVYIYIYMYMHLYIPLSSQT